MSVRGSSGLLSAAIKFIKAATSKACSSISWPSSVSFRNVVSALCCVVEEYRNKIVSVSHSQASVSVTVHSIKTISARLCDKRTLVSYPARPPILDALFQDSSWY